jgi:hypothetical protein
MISTIGVSNLANMVLFLSFGHLIFEICFGFRYSDFEFCQSHLRESCSLDLTQSRALWTLIFTSEKVVSC